MLRELLEQSLDLRLHKSLHRGLHSWAVRSQGKAHSLPRIVGTLIRQLNFRSQTALLLRSKRRPGKRRLGLRVLCKARECKQKRLPRLGFRIEIKPRVFGLEPLTARDAGAPSIADSFNRKVPRHVADWPQP